MKKYFLILICMLAMPFLFAQSPTAFNYQAVARDDIGALLSNQPISVRMSILDSATSTQAIYAEIHSITTNDFGLFTIAIGTGTPLGTASVNSLSDVDWSNGSKWLQTEIDPAGGFVFQLIGTSQLLSVPYATYAGWNQESDKIYHQGPRVGINNSNPLTRLHIGNFRSLLVGEIGGSGSAVFGEYLGFNAQLIGNTTNEFTKLAGGSPTGGGQRGGAAIICDVFGNLKFQAFDAGLGNDLTAISTPIAPQFEFRNDGTAAKPNGGSWTGTSDLRLKDQIEVYDQGISQLLQIQPIRYHYNGKLGLPTEKEYVGVIAQDLQKVAPKMVSEFTGIDGESYLEVDPSDLTYMLINAVKELNDKIEELEAEIEGLKKQ